MALQQGFEGCQRSSRQKKRQVPDLNEGISAEGYKVRKVAERKFPEFFDISSRICPEFCSAFSPNFSRTFRASFRGRRRPEKNHQKSPPFLNAKFPGKHEEIFTKFFWRAGKVTEGGPDFLAVASVREFPNVIPLNENLLRSFYCRSFKGQQD